MDFLANWLNTTALSLAVAVGLVILGLVLMALRQPILARLGLRNIPRRPTQSALIVIGLTLSTTIIISALSIGDTLNYSIQRQAVEAYGQIDQVISPAFLNDLIGLAENGEFDPENSQVSSEVQTLQNLSTGDFTSLLTLFQDGLPGIPMDRYQRLRERAKDEPLIDGVAGSILFPTIVRNVNTGQGEPLGFIFAVDSAYDEEFGLHSIDGTPVRMADLQPGVGTLFAGAADLFGGIQSAISNAAGSVGLESVGITEVALAVGAVGALLTTTEATTLTLDALQFDVATLRDLGIDTAFLDEQGISVISLETLGITTDQLAQLNIDPAAPITLPTLQSLGLTIPGLGSTQDLLGALNLNTLGQTVDGTLAPYGLQLRQGDLYLNRLGADQLNAKPGDLLEIFIGPIPVPYRVRAIVEESGPLGALTPVVMLPVSEAQQLLFMPDRVNNILISNQGDEMAGMALTAQVDERLRVLALSDEQVTAAAAILRRPAVAEIIAKRAPIAQSPIAAEMDGAPAVLIELVEGFTASGNFRAEVDGLAAALTADSPAADEAIAVALASSAVRPWLLDLPLARADADALSAALTGMDEFSVLSPLSKQFVVNGADLAGVAFGSIFSIFGTFSIFAGVLLIFLIFVMLAAERRAELGIARAVGMQRGHLVQMFVTEGMVYDLAAALVGLGLGLLVSYAMIGSLGGLFQTISQQVADRSQLFQLRWAVAPTSLIIGYCLGVLLTFFVVTIASIQVSRLNIVAAIRDLPDREGAQRVSWSRRLLRWSVGPILLALGGYLLWLGQEQGQTVTLVGATLALVGGIRIIGQILGRTRMNRNAVQRLVYSVIGVGLLVLWAVPWPTLTDPLNALFQQNPAYLLLSFALSGPFIILGAILVVMFNADSIAGVASRLLGGSRTLTPVLKTAIAWPLSARFRTGVTMLLFAMVITTVTVMSVVIQATEIATTPSAESTAGFEITISPGLLSFFDPVSDLSAEAAARPDFPVDAVAVMGSVSSLSAEARQTAPTSGGWSNANLTGVDAGYTQQAAGVYPFQMRAAGYASDAEIWQALGERDDVAVVVAQRVADRPEHFMGGSDEDSEEMRFDDDFDRRRLQLRGFSLVAGETLPPISMDVRFENTITGAVTRTVQIIGVLESDETLAGGSIQVNRLLLDVLNGQPVNPQSFYVKTAAGADVHATAQALERSLLSSGFNATLVDEQFAAGQAITRGILQLFQGFLALGLLVGIAALGVVSSRAVVERRQQIGMLRAIGYQPGMVALSFVLESSFIALTGILVGAATGLVLGDKMIGQFYAIVTETSFPIPWLSIGGMLLAAYLFALLMTILPAWQASRIYPAEALRYE